MDWVTIAALAIAAIALVISIREHRAFAAQIGARADLRVTTNVLKGRYVGSSIVEVGVSNEGGKAAGPTIVNVLIPDDRIEIARCEQDGTPIPAAALRTTPEMLPGESGPSIYLTWEIRRISIRSPHVFYVSVGHVLTRERAPIRVKVQSDDLPDDVREVVVDDSVPGSLLLATG